jgi:hypothetical protein
MTPGDIPTPTIFKTVFVRRTKKNTYNTIENFNAVIIS